MDAGRARSVLGVPGLSRLVERLRWRLELGRGLTGRLVLTAPSPAERDAVARLLGRPPAAGDSLSIELGDLDHALRHAGICDGLEEAVRLLTGDWVDRKAAREEAAGRWTRLLSGVGAWAEALAKTGLLRRLARGDLELGARLLEQARALESR